MAGTTAAQADSITLTVTRDEYNELVYSLGSTAGNAAIDASRSQPFQVNKLTMEQERYNRLVGLQSKMFAWGGFLTQTNAAGESPPAIREHSLAATS